MAQSGTEQSGTVLRQPVKTPDEGISMIRVGIVGTNTSHAGVFAGLLNGEDGASPRVPGGTVSGVWSSGRPGLSGMHLSADELARRYGVEHVAGEPEQLVELADAVMVLDDEGGGSLHGKLAEPFLAAGLPTFIDKPMTLDVTEAVRLFDFAEEHGAPLMSCSALRFAGELDAVTGHAAETGTLSTVVGVGPGDWYNYGVHTVQAVLAVTQPMSGDSWVHQHPGAERDVTVVGSGTGPGVVIHTLRDAAYLFHVLAYGADGMAQARIGDAAGFYAGTMAAFLEMARTRVPPVSRAETLQVLAILAAGQRSAETGERVRLADHMPERRSGGHA